MRRTGTAAISASAALILALAACSAGPNAATPAPSTTPNATASGSPSTSAGTASGAPTSPATDPQSTTSSPTTAPTTAPATGPGASYARGGTSLIPQYRLVGYAGLPGSPGMGRLGIGKVDDRTAEILDLAKDYDADKPVMPVLELIVTVVQSAPGRDGMYRTRINSRIIEDHLAAARRVDGILILNIQPGRASFLSELKAYEKWLKEPDVSVAIDPEWRMGPGQVPGKVYGHMTAKELNGVTAWLSDLVQQNGLPQKVLIYHQVAPGVVSNQKDIRAYPGVAIIKSADGLGAGKYKKTTWSKLVPGTPSSVTMGFKLFFEEDTSTGAPLMTPKEVLDLKPRPDYVLYE